MMDARVKPAHDEALLFYGPGSAQQREERCSASGTRRPQNDRLSFTSTQRPFLICWTCVTVEARWLVFEKIEGGEAKMSWNGSPDSSASSTFWPVRSLPALFT